MVGRTDALRKPYAWLKVGVLAGSLLPLLFLVVRAGNGSLGANPIAELLNTTGLLALIFLIASLACTPLKLWLELTWPLRIRRLLGLLAFFYATVHLLVYVALDRFGELGTLLEDVWKRPFITVGFAAYVLLVPLAITSTRTMLRRLGFRRWQRLHQLSYLAAPLAAVHFLWRVKKDTTEPLLYGALLLLLLGARVWALVRPRA